MEIKVFGGIEYHQGPFFIHMDDIMGSINPNRYQRRDGKRDKVGDTFISVMVAWCINGAVDKSHIFPTTLIKWINRLEDGALFFMVG